jgi:hypothetical protein
MSVVESALHQGLERPNVEVLDYMRDVAIHQTPLPTVKPSNPHISTINNELQQIVDQQVKKVNFMNKENSKDPETAEVPDGSDIPKPPVIGSSRLLKVPEYYEGFPLSATLQFIDYDLDKKTRDALNFWQIDERTKPFVLDRKYRQYLEHGYVHDLADREYKIASDYLNSIQ